MDGPALSIPCAAPNTTTVTIIDLLLSKIHGRLVVLKNGRYDNMPNEVVTATKKVVNVKEHHNPDRLRPHYKSFQMKPLFIMNHDLESV